MSDDCLIRASHSVGSSVNIFIDMSRDQLSSLSNETLGATIPVDESNVRQDKKGDEWVKWIGGSFAVLGAVVGGIAIANASHSEDNRRHRSNVHTGGGVYIEELDDDDENTNEWVTIPEASNHD